MVYNSKIHETLKQFEASGAPAKLQVIRQDDSIKMGTYSQVNPAFPGDIDFPLNSQLRDRIKEESTCRVITIAELRKIDARENRERFTVRGIVSLGEEEMEDLETTWGLKKIKRDIVMQDESGSIEFHVFANRLKELKDGNTYEITAMTLSDIRGIHLGLSKESSIKEIAPMKGLPEAAKITPSKKQFDVVGFDSVSREKIFFYCKCCKKEVLITEKTVPTWITCTNIKCNTDLRTTALKRQASCDVNFQISDGADMWAIIECFCKPSKGIERWKYIRNHSNDIIRHPWNPYGFVKRALYQGNCPNNRVAGSCKDYSFNKSVRCCGF